VAQVTLDRPDRLNAWTARMEREYRAALRQAEADPEVRAVVVTGAGRGFCAGADFKALDRIVEVGDYNEAAGTSPEGAGRQGEAAGAPEDHAPTLPVRLTKPVVAAVNGAAAGIGFVVMCFCDIRFAAAGAKLTTSFGRLGLPAEHGASWLLPRLVGPARAADLLFSSRVVLAEEAAEMGLVNRVLPPEEVLPFSLEYARRIAQEISPSSLREMKRQLWEDMASELVPATTRSVQAMERMVTEPDFGEAVAAARERRPPRFERG
jgi:enoyl-CoA hydratase/carnithine racemase